MEAMNSWETVVLGGVEARSLEKEFDLGNEEKKSARTFTNGVPY